MTRTFRAVLCSAITLLAAGRLSAQLISVSVTPSFTRSAGEAVYLTVQTSAISGFTASVYLTVSSPTIPDNLLTVSPGLINHPYTDQGSVKVEFDASVANGLHRIVVKAHNGPAVSYDTTMIVLQRKTPFRAFTMENSPLPSNGIAKIVVDHNGMGWVLTPDGVVTYDGINWAAPCSDTAFHIMPGFILGMAVGNDNSIWMVGVDDRGFGVGIRVMRYKNGRWSSSENPRDMQVSPTTAPIVVDSAGSVWVASLTALYKYDGTSWTAYPTEDPYILAAGHNGTMWIGARTGIPLRSFDGVYWTEFQPGFWQIAPTGDIRDVAVDRNNTVWMAAEKGISSMDPARHVQTYYSSDNHFPGYRPHRIAFDQFGVMWLGDQIMGLTRHDGTNDVRITNANTGLPSDKITSLAVGPDSTIWVGTADQGFVIIDAKNYPKPASMTDGNTRSEMIQTVRPNPARDNAAVDVAIPDGGRAVVSVIDGLGQPAIDPITVELEPGQHTVQLPLGGLASGVYIVSVESNGRVSTSRLVVAR